MQLLLVAEDAMLGDTICDGARQGDWVIDTVGNAVAANAILLDHAYAAALLDAGLPATQASMSHGRCGYCGSSLGTVKIKRFSPHRTYLASGRHASQLHFR